MVRFQLPDYKPTHSLNDFELLQDPKDKRSKLGVGSFATVKLAREKATGKLFALKIVDVDKASKTDLKNLKTEIYIHKDLDHPNIIKFHGYIQQENLICLVLDYADHGNLYTYLRRKKILTEKEVFRFFYQTCLAINYLHEKNIIHRDIKPENLLLDKDFNIKVCDFGWSAFDINQERKTFCGTYEYMAPEILHEQTYDYRVDIWALGILLYELLHNKAPFKGRSVQEIKNSLSKSQLVFDEKTQQDAKALIEKILHSDPNSRILMDQILNCSWVAEQIEKEENFRKTIYQEDQKFLRTSSNNKFKIFDGRTETRHQSFLGSVLSTQQAFSDARELSRSISTPEETLNKLLQDRSPNLSTQYSSHSSANVKGSLIDEVSSPSSAIMLHPTLSGPKTPKKSLKKKRIFDENLLSPAFNHRLKRIINDLNPKSLPTLPNNHDNSGNWALNDIKCEVNSQMKLGLNQQSEKVRVQDSKNISKKDKNFSDGTPRLKIFENNISDKSASKKISFLSGDNVNLGNLCWSFSDKLNVQNKENELEFDGKN